MWHERVNWKKYYLDPWAQEFMLAVPCPRCRAPVGTICVQPNGKNYFKGHKAREKFYTGQPIVVVKGGAEKDW